MLSKILDQKYTMLDVNHKNNEGNTALIYSVINNNILITSMLLKNGADVNIKNALGETAIQIASLKQFDQIEQLLIQFKTTTMKASSKKLVKVGSVIK